MADQGFDWNPPTPVTSDIFGREVEEADATDMWTTTWWPPYTAITYLGRATKSRTRS